MVIEELRGREGLPLEGGGREELELERGSSGGRSPCCELCSALRACAKSICCSLSNCSSGIPKFSNLLVPLGLA